MDNTKKQDLIKLFQNNPMRKLEYKDFLSKEFESTLDTFEKDLHFQLSNTKPLNLVFMGEVKAGKSTLLNALLGQQLSNIGVTETTASIIEIEFGEEEKSTIVKKDNTKQILSIKKAYELLENNKNDQEFFQEIQKIVIQTNNNTLKKYHIVDTPGIETITSQNEELTYSFIQEADVVLWVISSLHLGQVDIEEQIEKVFDYGKPVILLVNRIDQANGTVEEIMEYVEETYDYYYEEAFPTSGFLALEGKINDNPDIIQKSGLPELVHYIETHIEPDVEKVKRESVDSSIKHILINEKKIVELVKLELNRIKETIENQENDHKISIENIEKSIDREIERWSDNFLRDEESELYELLDNRKGFLDNPKDVTKRLGEITSNNYIKDKVIQFQNDLNVVLQSKIEAEYKRIETNLTQEQLYTEQSLDSFIYDSNKELLMNGHEENELIVGAKNGAIVGGTYAAASVASLALLTPGVGIAAMGSAISAAVPPFLFVGAATGAAIKFINRDKKINEIREQINKSLTEARTEVTKHLKTGGYSIKKSVHKHFTLKLEEQKKLFYNNLSQDEFNMVIHELDKYRQELNYEIEIFE